MKKLFIPSIKFVFESRCWVNDARQGCQNIVMFQSNFMSNLVVLRRVFEAKQKLKLCWRWPKGDVETVFAQTYMETSILTNKRTRTVQIGHFQITFDLFFKASPGAHPFIWKLIFICMWMKANFYMKRWTPGLALKKRPKVIRKWFIGL